MLWERGERRERDGEGDRRVKEKSGLEQRGEKYVGKVTRKA